ncbi:DUF2808 domain-containing protein [Tumidithrix elongata RA019]|uniref:DUF2808 domain-containing protein n=1 Tax=Tumidithrix elongata BACA0141 TaxID=2716417 RepID=A0AAW9Q918_9CYAN|nr:DUF2808 domain-containing protein [Tumidithrix elongata RA019]
MLHKKTLVASFLLFAAIFSPPVVRDWSNSSVQAVQLRDGKTYFLHPPTLIDATTTSNRTHAWGATYYFTIQTASDAGEPLQSVTIAQNEGSDTVAFQLGETLAYAQDAGSDRTPLISKTTLNPETRTLSIVFDPPVPAGKTVVISLYPSRNPRYEGVYLFGVTAFPPGSQPHGQFLGYGRLHFYSSSRW